ncbi:MAG: electron transfer flavoprotein beta subunit/FixA family protein [Planctomycetes bacterium]|nr:electron transfer flavoprotein beta subunit/FixA family protein [Planctomycetota bacterium]
MKITVCVKRVPSTTARIKIGADGRSIDETGVEFVLNPYDEFAVEEALRQAERSGGSVTVITFGGEAAGKELRTCLAMGAHDAVHVTADGSARDALATAKILAAAIQPTAPELVLFGRQAMDGDQGQVGLMVATLLGMAALPDVVKLEIAGGTAKAEREIEGAIERFELPLPCVITCNKGLNEPRLPNMKGIMAAKKKTIAVVAACAAATTTTVAALELPPERAAGKIVGEGAAAVPALLRLLRDEAHAL